MPGIERGCLVVFWGARSSTLSVFVEGLISGVGVVDLANEQDEDKLRPLERPGERRTLAGSRDRVMTCMPCSNRGGPGGPCAGLAPSVLRQSDSDRLAT